MENRRTELGEEIIGKIEEDPFPHSLGMEILELRPGYARVGLLVKENMVNMHGITHGGVVFTLADVAFGQASNTHGIMAVALNVNFSFLKTSKPGDYLIATACEENLTKRTGLYRLDVKNGDGELVALAHGLVYRKQQ
jgi:acyl-CoA thioesterase